MRLKNMHIWLYGAFVLMLAACGGGGDGGIGGTGGTQPGSDVSIGTITAKGSVWINGVRFDDSSATITIDDNPKGDDDLKVGMVARVSGSISGGTATAVRVTSAAKGYVESVGAGSMVVMGQTVITDASTIFSNGTVAAGQYVEVHGQVVSDGTIQASFVERKTALADPPFVVKGLVKGHNTATNTFQVGNLNVTLAAGATINDMPGGTWNGILAEVKGSNCAGNPVCGTLTASKVEPEGPRGDVAKIEVEAFVTALTSSSDFTVGSQRVVTTGSTVFVGGAQNEIVLGLKLEVEGSLSGGILTATKVSFRENIRFEANVFSKSGTTFTLAGLPGITIDTNALTEFKDVANVAALALNNNVRVRGRPGPAGTVIATEVEDRGTARNDVRFQAIASSAADPNLTMLGITVNTSNISQFRDLNDAPISRAQFFNAIGAGNKLVKVRGALQLPGVNWNDEAELED
jgi:hypothetical protein